MPNSIVPDSVKLAAKRGMVRTTYQALAATLTTGVSATVVLGVVSGEVEVIPTAVTLAVALVSPFIAGAASYLSITANGIPKDYADVTLVQQAVLEPVEAAADQDAAVARVLLRRDLKG